MRDKHSQPNDKFFDVCKNGTATDVKNAIAAETRQIKDIKWKNDFTPLMVAVCDNPNFDVVSELIKVEDINAQDANKQTALMQAVLRCVNNPDSQVSFEAVRVLIANGADVNLQDENGMTALMLALQEAQNLDVIFRCFGDIKDLNIDFNLHDKNGLMVSDFVEKGVREGRFANDQNGLFAINSLITPNVVDDDE